MKKIFLLTLILGAFFMACSKPKNAGSKGETITVQTEKGEVKLPKKPKKVVVFDYGILDTMKALDVSGVELAVPSGDLAKSLDDYKKNAVEAGDIKEPNLEKISEFQPDLIIVSGRQNKFYDELKKIAPTFYAGTDAKDYMNSMYKNVEIIAQIFGKEDEAKKQIEELKKEVSNAKNEISKSNKKVLVTITNDGSISAFGLGSRFGFVFSDLGAKSVDDTIKPSTHGQEINFEYISEKNPDVIFYVDRSKAIGEGTKSGADVFKNDLVANTNAGKNNKIIALDAEIWYLVAGGLNSTRKQISEIRAGLQ